MSDAEWDEWRASWAGAAGPLPDVRATAVREARRHRRAKIAYLACAVIALAGATEAWSIPEAVGRFIAGAIVAFVLAMVAGYALIERGAGAAKVGDPRGAMAFLERRLVIERRMAHLVRWVYAALVAGFAPIMSRVVEGHSHPRLELTITSTFMALTFVATFSAPWWVARRNRPHQEELARWRKWMDEQGL